MKSLMKIPEAMTDEGQSTIPMERQIQGAHLYDKARRWRDRHERAEDLRRDARSRRSRRSSSPTST